MSSSPLYILGALSAVLLWSLKPSLILLLDGLPGPTIYSTAMLMSLAGSLLLTLFLRSKLAPLFSKEAALYLTKNTILSGAGLATWYLCFYIGLKGSVSVQVAIISFSWPIVAVIAMRFIAPDLQDKLKSWQWIFVILGFLGAAITALSGKHDMSSIGWGVLSALGSGLYLPFLIRATNYANTSLSHPPLATFASVSLTNLFSILVALPLFAGIGLPILPQTSLPVTSWLLLGVIGMGIYLYSELAWSWSIYVSRSPALSTLPFFTPILSTLLLVSFFEQPAPAMAGWGLLLVIIANIAVNTNPSTWKKLKTHRIFFKTKPTPHISVPDTGNKKCQKTP